MNDVTVDRAAEPEIADWFRDRTSQLTDWRHELHQHPELAFEEHWTSDFVARTLAGLGYAPERGIGETGVVATLSTGDGPAVGLRCELDGLPIEEKTGLGFASRRPGRMHACGHDGHMAMLLGAAAFFAEHPPAAGTVHFIFQPAEENEAGAAAMIRDGLFDRFPVDEVYALHNWPGLTEGRIAARKGPQMAAFDLFEIVLQGAGCHAAMPHMGQDVLLAAAHIQLQLQTIVARQIDPLESAVVSVTQIHGGDTWNVLPGEVVLRGCTRHFSRGIQERIEDRMRGICDGAAASFGLEVRLDYIRRYPATCNTPRETAVARKAAAAVLGPDHVVAEFRPSMASEDFAFLLNERPGCYAWLGAGSTEGGNYLHSPTFRFNDRILPTGAAWLVSTARHALRARAIGDGHSV